MVSRSICAFAVIPGVILMAAPPARAEIQLEPGLWQDTEVTVTDGRPGKPEVNTTCLSAEEARDPVKTMMKETEGQRCDTRNVRQNGNTVIVEMKCADPEEKMSMSLDMTIHVLDRRHYTGTIKSLIVFKGQKIPAEGTVDSKWIASVCKK
jgi:hypothetical protein